MTKILIIDDDASLVEQLSAVLTRDGYEVVTAANGNDGMTAFRISDPDLILLDITMPEKDGWQVCREIRQQSLKPIIIISHLGETIDKILGLELGADDYMVKPLDTKELTARIKALLRRTVAHSQPEIETIKLDNMEISLQKYQITVGGVQIDMPPKELQLLYFLASNSGNVYTRDQLLDKVWGFDYPGDSRTVDVHIKRLREKLDGISDKWHIKTVWGVGYKFELL